MFFVTTRGEIAARSCARNTTVASAEQTVVLRLCRAHVGERGRDLGLRHRVLRLPQFDQCQRDDAAADAIATVLVNELFNTITDPGFTAWYDELDLEPADNCAWTFGTTYTTGNGARANVRLGARDYLLQQLWNRAAKVSCTMG